MASAPVTGATPALLITEGLGRLEARGAEARVERAEDADHRREEHRLEGDDRLDRRLDPAHLDDARRRDHLEPPERHPERSAEDREREPLEDDEAADPGAGPADRAQEPDLARTLEDGHEHRVRD